MLLLDSTMYMAAQTLNTISFDSTSTYHHECHRLLAVWLENTSIWNAVVAALQF